ncbi:Uncharacterised protein [uncultured archaeon]|nr:Uncharacterised protein [uncultured archaeon]
MKKGQITVFIIIGIILLFAIGTAIYIYQSRAGKEYEAARPAIEKLPQQVQPLRDLMDSCILQLGTDGLKKIGDSGGYIDTKQLLVNPASPTDGDAVELSPGAGPSIAYWWYMKSNNKCDKDCLFDTKRPPLYRSEGSTSIETQLDKYVTENLKNCLGDFETFRQKGCTVQELGTPQVTANVAEEDVFFVGKYPLRAVCEGQTFDVQDAYVSIPLNLREIYELATEIVNLETQQRILEQATKTLMATYSEIDSSKLPPSRGFEIGPPSPGQYWIKLEVLKKLKEILVMYIPLIQTSSVRNYNYLAAPAGTRDPELYEMLYNRQFFIPLNTTHPELEARFSYLDWWEPYFDLNCNGQLCQADSASNFKLLPFSINRYNFAYDLSYPVMVEIRNPDTFNRQGYSFKFMLEENMRNSESFATDTKLPPTIEPPKTPSIFCDPIQRTSGNISIFAKDGYNLQGLDEATVSYICGNNNCNLGLTKDGKFASKFPRCIGGTLRITKQGYASYSAPLDVLEDPLSVSLILEPIRTFNATIKNYPITKAGKWEQWSFIETIPQRPPENQSATIMLTKNATPYEESFVAVTEIKGANIGQLALVPGHYAVRIMSFLKENISIPPDRRCTQPSKIAGMTIVSKECYFVPETPITFNETSPFPYGGAEYEITITPDVLRGKTQIEFKQFITAIEKVKESNRIVEDLGEIGKISMYAEANKDRLQPVIT